MALAGESPGAFFTYGTVLLNAKMFRDAQRALETSISLKPDRAEAHVNLAKALLGQGSTKRAYEEIQAALALNPALEEAWNMKAMVAARLDMPVTAEQSAQEALRLAPDSARAHLAEGVSALKRLDATKARDEFREVLRLDPQNVYARNGYLAAARLSLPFFKPILSRSGRPWARCWGCSPGPSCLCCCGRRIS